MGKLTEQVIANTDLPLDQKLSWHLQGNHYPPLPTEMVVPCLQAIELASLDYWNSEIELPAGITWQNSTTLSVAKMVELCHLETFITTEKEKEQIQMGTAPTLLIPTLTSVIAELESHLETLENEHAPITNGRAMNILRETINHLNKIKESN
jgi:hypothetical protein